LSAVVRRHMSVTSDSNGVCLVNDVDAPGGTKLYGTDATGAKGWYDQPARRRFVRVGPPPGVPLGRRTAAGQKTSFEPSPPVPGGPVYSATGLDYDPWTMTWIDTGELGWIHTPRFATLRAGTIIEGTYLGQGEPFAGAGIRNVYCTADDVDEWVCPPMGAV